MNQEERFKTNQTLVKKSKGKLPRSSQHDLIFFTTIAIALLRGIPQLPHLPHSFQILGVLVSLPLLLIVRSVPIVGARERPLTFTAPVVFGLCLWFSPGIAAWSAILSHLLWARFAQRGRANRAFTRFQGSQLALSSFAVGKVLSYFPLRHALLQLSIAQTVAPAALAAIVFLAVLLPLSFFLPQYVPGIPADSTLHRMGQPTLVYTAGMIPILLLMPLTEQYGIAAGVPTALLLLFIALIFRLNTEVHNLRHQLRIAEEMGRAGMTGEETPEAVLKNFLELTRELIRSERALVWLQSLETKQISLAVAHPDPGPFAGRTYMSGEGLVGHAALRYRPRLIPDASRDPHRGQKERAFGSWLFYPIVVNQQVLGVAHWIRPASNPFTLDDIACLDNIIPQVTITLENQLIRSDMRLQATTDGLTGLINQKRIQELMREETIRSSRYHRPYCILMLDVDSFKSFNDTYGHPQGDRLLRNISTILRNNVRSIDYTGRYGGEEFLIILPETTRDDALRMAERLRNAVEEFGWIMLESGPARRTVSIGVASYPEDALNANDMVQRADEALYKAKRSGKNCVCIL